MLLSTEGDIRCPRLRNLDGLDQSPGGVENQDPFASEIQIALPIEGHPIRALLAEKAFISERPIASDGILVGLARADIGDEERFAVGGANDAIGLGQILGHASDGFAISGSEVHLLSALRGFVVGPPRAFVEGVREEKGAVLANPDVVGAVELAGVMGIEQDLDFAFGGDGDELGFFVGAGDELAAAIEEHAVGAAGGLEEGGDGAVEIPLHDPIVGLIGEVDVALLVSGGALGEGELAGDFREGRARCEGALGGEADGGMADDTASQQGTEQGGEFHCAV